MKKNWMQKLVKHLTQYVGKLIKAFATVYKPVHKKIVKMLSMLIKITRLVLKLLWTKLKPWWDNTYDKSVALIGWSLSFFPKIYNWLKINAWPKLVSFYEQYLAEFLAPLLNVLYPYYIKIRSWITYQIAVIQSHPTYQFAERIMFSKTLAESEFSIPESNSVEEAIRPYMRAFGKLMLGFGIVFVIWGILAPLDSATIANGSIKLYGNRKIIQHPQGGVIKAILVHDGQTVKAGEALIEIDETTAKAEVNRIESALLISRANKQRVLAQQNNAESIEWPDELFDKKNQEVVELIKTQEELFKTRVAIYHGNRHIKLDQNKMRQEKLQSLQAKLKAYEAHHKSYDEEVNGLAELHKKGLVRKNDFYRMQREYDNILAEEINTKSEIANVEKEIDLVELEVLTYENDYRTKLSDEYNEAQARILDLTEQLVERMYVYQNSVIKSPVDGVVTELAYHTIGGVIQPGQKIMDIIPQDDKLIIEARVETKDIDSIRPGLIAKISLNAYKQRIVPRLDGKVIHVAADVTVDERGGGMPFYVARVEIDEQQLAQVNSDIKLYPGMPVTVFIVKGERTFFNYMISPILDTFHRAFKEQ